MNENAIKIDASRESDNVKSVVDVMNWIVILLLMCIPVVNIVLMFIWAFGNENENIKNYARASLVVGCIFLIGALVFMIFVMGISVTGY